MSYSTSGGTATAGADYTAASGSLTFASGETSKTITVATLDDSDGEQTESFNLLFSVVEGDGAFANASVSGSIIDNDFIASGVALSASDATTVGGVLSNGDLTIVPTGMGAGSKEIVRTNAPPMNGGGVYYWEIVIDAPRSGQGGEFGLIADQASNILGRWDYQTLPFAMVSASGAAIRTRGNITANLSSLGSVVAGDVIGVYFNSSTGSAYLSQNGTPVGGWTEAEALAGGGTPTLTGFDPATAIPIYSIDWGSTGQVTYKFSQADLSYFPGISVCVVGVGCAPPAAVVVGSADVTVTEGQSLTFTLAASGTSPDPVEVSYITGNGSATAGTDYITASGSVIFASGETSKTITISTTDDSDAESSETFDLTLAVVSGDGALTNTNAVGTINDNDTIVSNATLKVSDATTVGGTLSNGNLTIVPSGMGAGSKETVRVDAPAMTGGGVYYWEVKVDAIHGGNFGGTLMGELGLLADQSINITSRWDDQNVPFAMISASNSTIRTRGSVSTNVSSISPRLDSGDVVGVYFNSTTGAAYVAVNGTPIGNWAEQGIVSGTGTPTLTGFNTASTIPIYSIDWGSTGQVTYRFSDGSFSHQPGIAICIVGVGCP